jgi:hypothetical protein
MSTELNPNDDSQFQKIDMSTLDGYEDADTQLNENQSSLQDDFAKEFMTPDEIKAQQPPAKEESRPPADHGKDATYPADYDPNKKVEDSKEDDEDEGDLEDEDFDLKLEDLEKGIEDEVDPDVEAFNRIMKTDFKTMAEVEAFKSEVRSEEVNEERQQVDQARQLNETYDAILKMPIEDAVFYDVRRNFQKDGKDVNNEMVIQEIKEEVNRQKDLGILQTTYRAFKMELESYKRENNQVIQSFESKQSEAEKEQESLKKQKMYETAADILKAKTYMGVQVSRKDAVKAYNNANKNNLRNLIDRDPATAFELELLYSMKDKIMSVLSRPGYDAGVDEVLSKLEGKASSSNVQVKRTSDSSGGSKDVGSLWAS